MVNAQTLNDLFENQDSQELDVITENEVVTLFSDHGAESDVDSYLYNVSTPTLSSALEFLGY